ncbi:hypothetical protein Prubr_46520 [Polymorphospora rubra]|uniref:Uncharacterized protein n=1 Tax=Polymorphospora rubra TaxID=338584 RepID=A0A810N1X8_9ACTN|nr:hypothetical protein Prubr_46520 [Polymorphospora rubra]
MVPHGRGGGVLVTGADVPQDLRVVVGGLAPEPARGRRAEEPGAQHLEDRFDRERQELVLRRLEHQRVERAVRFEVGAAFGE